VLGGLDQLGLGLEQVLDRDHCPGRDLLQRRHDRLRLRRMQQHRPHPTGGPCPTGPAPSGLFATVADDSRVHVRGLLSSDSLPQVRGLPWSVGPTQVGRLP
jgi:hypothetical protein